MANAAPTRTERDSMGEMTVPADALYGATTQRAVENFPISGRPVPMEVVVAFARLKKACAETNAALGRLDEARARLIADACDRIIEEDLAEHFPIDVFQTGSGTSTNMNVNEVVANLACLARDQPIGSRDHEGAVHPNDHVNMGQSSNDTFPTAMQVAAAVAIRERLVPALKRLAKELEKKSRKWDDVVKVGRTHLMDATPIRLGQEFSGYAAQTRHAVTRAERALEALAGNLPIGGTAVGTGINTHRQFGRKVCASLKRTTRIPFAEAENHFEAQATRDCVVEASGHLRTIAVSLSKIANDIRLLGSGPRCGLFELALPATQPGSSIMPGKVNPVICESIVQVACTVIGHDAAIAAGGLGGTGSLLELNVAMPMMADHLIDSIRLLGNGAGVMTDRLVIGLEVNRDVATGYVDRSLMLGTRLAPVIGYDEAANVAKECFKRGLTIREYCLENGILDPKALDELLDARAMTDPE